MAAKEFRPAKKIYPRFEFKDFDNDPRVIRRILDLELPPLQQQPSSALDQLDFIERHLRNFEPQGCRSMIFEHHYIDRNFIADFGAFYASSLFNYPNYCRRILFFTNETHDLKSRIKELLTLAHTKVEGESKHDRELKLREAAAAFSKDFFLGFCVIKPLNGAPVGRTVLRHYPPEKSDGTARKFNCTRLYRCHIFGIELAVCGLVFQQQDQAVAACATTALWTSLSKTKDFEDIRTPTPAQITKLATQYALHTGRSLPQVEGLTLDQMCQAIESLGLSPYVVRPNDPLNTRSLLYSSVISGLAPILIISHPRLGGHAVAVSGMKVTAEHKQALREADYPDKSKILFDDTSGDLIELYVNDDRFSPYFKVDLKCLSPNLELHFVKYSEARVEQSRDVWTLRSILIPLHSKIRLSFAELHELSYAVLRWVTALREFIQQSVSDNISNIIQIKTGVIKHSTYTHNLLFGDNSISPANSLEFNKKVVLSRYVGRISLIEHSSFGYLDVLVDTTNIGSNPNFLAVICRTAWRELAEQIVVPLATELDCHYIIDDVET